jgi:hypothetical protein
VGGSTRRRDRSDASGTIGRVTADKGLVESTKQLGLTEGVGQAAFGEQFGHGQDIKQSHLDNIQSAFDHFSVPYDVDYDR